MLKDILYLRDLNEAYPDFADFINKMYSKWMLALVESGGDEHPAAASFVKHFVTAIPDTETLKNFMEYANKNTDDDVSPETFASWVIFVGSEELEKFRTVAGNQL